MPIDSSARVKQVVATDQVRFGIGKKRKCVTGFLAKIARVLGRVYADRNWTNPHLFELSQTILNAPQLGVA